MKSYYKLHSILGEQLRPGFKWRWPLALAALALAYLLPAGLGQNAAGVYDPRSLLWALGLAPLLFAGLVFAGSRLAARLERLAWNELLALLAFSLALGALLAWWFPPPAPALIHPHTLRLAGAGEQNPDSRGAKIEVRGLRGLDGKAIPLESLQLSGDWRLAGGLLVSDGSQPGSTAELSGALPDGVAVYLNFGPKAGRLLVDWDGQAGEADLYWKWPVSGDLPFGGSPWGAAGPAERALLVAGGLLYWVGLSALFFGLALVLHLRLLPPRLQAVMLALIYLGIFLVYARFKVSFASFNAERVYGDTITYVQTAERSLADFHFWFSDRSFSLPLLYKAAGMTSANFTEQDVMQRVGDYQMWLSMAGWTLLALATAGSPRRRWLAPFAFTAILFFSLSLEVSLWDRMMLSEALSYALLAALLALWIGLETLPLVRGRGWLRALYLLALLAVTLFFSFTRDTNLYFLLVAAGVMVAGALFKRSAPENRGLYLLYAAAIAGLFVFQNLTIRLGDRWQVHVYDHLARRVVLDEKMLAYFQARGLPVSQKLLDLKNLGVGEYQRALFFSQEAEYAAVRAWVQQSGQSTYLHYLLDHPEYSLGGPLRQFDRLINGNNTEYRYPAFPGQPVPRALAMRDDKLYPRSPPALAGMLLLVSAGCLLYWLGRSQAQPAWLMLTIMLIGVPLLCFIVWNGNPLEIERHAIQIGVQFRLGGWIAFILALDWGFGRLANGASRAVQKEA